MTPAELDALRANLLQANLSPDDVATLRTLQRGTLAGVPVFTVPGGDPAVRLWTILRTIMPLVGRYPVILGPTEHFELEDEYPDYGHNQSGVTAMLGTAQQADDSGEWLEQLIQKFDKRRIRRPGESPRSELQHMHGEWPTGIEPRHCFVGTYFGQAPWPQVGIVLTDCLESWQVPAALGIDHHNDRGPAAEQCAALRSWQRRYGAEIMLAHGPVFEFRVGRPPTSRADSLALAREQYFFCPDRVDQYNPDQSVIDASTEGTLEGLAAMLLNSTSWYFWWD